MVTFWRWGRSLNALFTDREWSLVFKDFPQPPATHGIPIVGSARCSLARILFDAGGLLTPATSQIFLPPLFPIFRYAHLFTGTQPDLALPPGIEDLDPDLIGALSKDLAVGVTAVLARRLWGVPHLADVEPLMAQGQVSRINPPPDLAYAKSRPDYIGLNAANEAIFFEAKGAAGPPSKLKNQRAKGKKQVCNVESQTFAMRPTANRIVVSTHLPIKGANKAPRATTFLDDPDMPRSRKADDQPNDLLVRHAYAKFLSLAGLADIGALLILRQPLPAWLADFESFRLRDRDFVPVGPFPLGGTICVERRVWKLLLTVGEDNLLAAVGPALVGLPHDDAAPIAPEGEAARVWPGPPAVVLNNGAALVNDGDSGLGVFASQRLSEAEW